MNEQKFHQLIEERNPDGKESLQRKVQERLNLPKESEITNKSVSKARAFFKSQYRVVSSLSSAFAVLCLAIIIPVVLNNRVTTSEERYCYATDCVGTVVDYSIKGYSEQNGLNMLYIDWYDSADEVQTKLFVNINDNSDIIYFQETIVNGKIGSIAALSITDVNTNVDVFEALENMCVNVDNIASISVNWSFQNSYARAYFVYDGYKYIIELEYPLEENSILELVESMITKA